MSIARHSDDDCSVHSVRKLAGMCEMNCSSEKAKLMAVKTVIMTAVVMALVKAVVTA